jgi:hypothetical protein
MSDSQDKKINSTVLAIALALITSFTSLGTAYINSSSNDKNNVITKENFEELIRAIKKLDERSLITYMSLTEDEVKRARDRIEYQKNGKSLNNIIRSKDKSAPVPSSLKIFVEPKENARHLDTGLMENVEIKMKVMP